MIKYIEKTELTRMETNALKKAQKTSPLMTFQIVQPEEGAKEGDIYLRGSFIHSSGEELAAVTQIASENTYMHAIALAEDAAQGYEADRKRKVGMTIEEIHGK